MAERIELLIDIDESLYHSQAVLRTCYWFTDRCYLFVNREAPGRLKVRLRAKDTSDVEDLSIIADEFTNALLDYELRRLIDEQSGTIRDALIARAFAAAGEPDFLPPGDALDPVDQLVQLTPYDDSVAQS